MDTLWFDVIFFGPPVKIHSRQSALEPSTLLLTLRLGNANVT